jgi:hypothetical protein
MIAAMNGVQAPGNINMSDIIMIRAPVRNPIAGPKAKPVTNVRVSVRPILIRMPKNGVGLLKAKFPNTILPTAPTAIKAAVEVTCFDVNVRLSLQRHGWIIHPSKKPVVYSTLTFPIISSEQGCYEILPLKVGTVTSKSVCASLGARTREPKTQTREALLKGLPWIVVGSLFVCVCAPAYPTHLYWCVNQRSNLRRRFTTENRSGSSTSWIAWPPTAESNAAT